jgi:hypothetical protein
VAVLLLPVVAFCCLGMLATFELAAWSQRLPWLLGYGVIGIGCTALVTWLFVRACR